MGIHSSILAWRIPWTQESGGLQSIGLQRVRYDYATKHFHFHNMYQSQYQTSFMTNAKGTSLGGKHKRKKKTFKNKPKAVLGREELQVGP